MGFFSVAAGAFGDHWVKPQLVQWHGDAAASHIENWQTAARYLMYHALACCVLGCLPAARSTRTVAISGSCFVAGGLLFSGGLWGYALTGARPLVHIVPLGGVAFLVGWLALLVVAFQARRRVAP
jgi:uncharacterized membrane protein YgdD (TMEM256/DUF423 family)